MTFLVNHRGEVFEKDLGPRSPRPAAGIASFNPDHTWKKIEAATAAGITRSK
jgi:hypothetical protein